MRSCLARLLACALRLIKPSTRLSSSSKANPAAFVNSTQLKSELVHLVYILRSAPEGEALGKASRLQFEKPVICPASEAGTRTSGKARVACKKRVHGRWVHSAFAAFAGGSSALPAAAGEASSAFRFPPPPSCAATSTRLPSCPSSRMWAKSLFRELNTMSHTVQVSLVASTLGLLASCFARHCMHDKGLPDLWPL